MFCHKWESDGRLIKFKARLVLAAWWMKRGVHYSHSYSSTGCWSDVLDLKAAAANYHFDVY